MTFLLDQEVPDPIARVVHQADLRNNINFA